MGHVDSTALRKAALPFAALALFGCEDGSGSLPLAVVDTEDPSTTPDLVCVDVSPEVCDGRDDDCNGLVDDVWWDGGDVRDSPPRYRLLLELDGPAHGVARAPVGVDVDFRAALDALGDPSPLNPASVRAVPSGCLAADGLPTQFIPGFGSLHERGYHQTGPDAGTLAFVWDEDGDPTTDEVLPPTVRLAIYFDSVDSAPALVVRPDDTGMTVTPTAATDAVGSASFNPVRGGMLEALTLADSPVLTTLSHACCGNGIYSYEPDAWWGPSDAPGTLELLAAGPVIALYRASGERPVTSHTGLALGAFEYKHLYWRYAGRPEVWTSVWQRTVGTTTAIHEDVADGFRPWESKQPWVDATVEYDTDPDAGWGAVTGADWGMAFGVSRAPTWLTNVANPAFRDDGSPFPAYFYFAGNDVVPPGQEAPYVMDDGTVYFRNTVMVALPYAAPFEQGVIDELLGLMEGTRAQVLGQQALPPDAPIHP